MESYKRSLITWEAGKHRTAVEPTMYPMPSSASFQSSCHAHTSTSARVCTSWIGHCNTIFCNWSGTFAVCFLGFWAENLTRGFLLSPQVIAYCTIAFLSWSSRISGKLENWFSPLLMKKVSKQNCAVVSTIVLPYGKTYKKSRWKMQVGVRIPEYLNRNIITLYQVEGIVRTPYFWSTGWTTIRVLILSPCLKGIYHDFKRNPLGRGFECRLLAQDNQ